MKKKVLGILTVISMVVSMTACAGGGDASTTTAKTQAKTEAASQKTESEGKETQPSVSFHVECKVGQPRPLIDP